MKPIHANCVDVFLSIFSLKLHFLKVQRFKNLILGEFYPQKKAANQKYTINVGGLVQLELSHMVQKMLGMQRKVIFMVVGRGRVNNVLYPK